MGQKRETSSRILVSHAMNYSRISISESISKLVQVLRQIFNLLVPLPDTIKNQFERRKQAQEKPERLS